MSPAEQRHHHFEPPWNYKHVLKQTVSKGRKKINKVLTFQHSWMEKYKWLVYSPSQEGGYCKFCVLFPPKDPRIKTIGVLVQSCMQKLHKVSGKDGYLAVHDNLEYHNAAVEQGMAVIRGMLQPKTTLPYRISSQNRELYARN